MLVNAIYLKAKWLTHFEASATGPAAFLPDGGSSENVPTMHGDVVAALGAHGGVRLLDLPYYAGKGPKLSMLLVVPESHTLPMVEADYAKEGLLAFTKSLAANNRVAVALPEFETGTSAELAPALSTFGMTDAFSDKANFKGMSQEPLRISAVVHKAWIKVNEGGTEAAAATGVVFTNGAIEAPPTKKFAVDRSFLFFVHDDQGNVLFAGRIVDPTK